MKNILAENLLRFGLKNADVAVVNKLQSLSEQSEQDPTMVSAGQVVGDMQLAPGALPVKLTTVEGGPVVFNGTNNFENNLAAESDQCVVYRHSSDKYIAIGMIGTLDTNSRTIKNPVFKAILFRAIPATPKNNTIGAVADKVSIPAKTPYFVIAKIVKSLVPNLGRQASAYLTRDKNGIALLSGIVNMYKMNGQMTEFDIDDSQQLLNLANMVGKSKTMNT